MLVALVLLIDNDREEVVGSYFTVGVQPDVIVRKAVEHWKATGLFPDADSPTKPAYSAWVHVLGELPSASRVVVPKVTVPRVS